MRYSLDELWTVLVSVVTILDHTSLVCGCDGELRPKELNVEVVYSVCVCNGEVLKL